MKPIYPLVTLLLGFASLQFPIAAFGQIVCEHPVTRTWIRVEDAHNDVDTLWFGYTLGGSCAADSAACELSTGGVPCGPPAEILCTWWEVCPPSYTLMRYNYHATDSAGQPDTFWLAFIAAHPVRLSWSINGIRALYDSVVIKDHFPGLFYHVRMDLDSTVLIDNPVISDLSIYTYGIPTPIDPEENSSIPQQTRLYQNYPNPFNPTTTITFELETSEKVLVQISDVVGQVISTLVDGRQSAGIHTVTWDAEHVPGGVYFCRLITPSSTKTTKLILIK